MPAISFCGALPMSFPAWTADSALTTHSLSGQKSFSTVHSVNMVHGVAVTVTNISATSNGRSEEHTSELQSLMRISYAVFCLKTKNTLYILQHILFVYISDVQDALRLI